MPCPAVFIAWLTVFAGQPKAVFPRPEFDFGKAIHGEVLVHEFKVRNQGGVPLKILRISMTPPLVAAGMPKEIAPGAEAAIVVKLDTSLLRGAFEGKLIVFLNDPELPEQRLAFEGRVISTVEVSPRAAFFVGARRGEAREASVEIVNHEAEPLRIEGVEHSNEWFTTRLETLAQGQRYRLTLALKPDGPGGRHTEPIIVKTSSKNHPNLTILANTVLRERVYVFPDEIDLGVLPLAQIRNNPGALKALAQMFIVHQTGGTDFKVNARAEAPGVEVKTERGPQGDRYEITVSLAEEQLKPGRIKGRIVIETNDAAFPRLTVPVSGYVIE